MFAYDHLFRRNAAGERRPAIEMFALMGAVAGGDEADRGGLARRRATLRPPAVLANGFDTLARILGPERLLVAIGAGDEQSREENETFGLDFGTVADRVAALRDAVDATRDRGYPVWIGGTDPAVREVAAAHADGWNRWGSGVERFREQAANLSAAAARSPFTVTWGGLVVLGDDDEAAAAKAERLGVGDHVIVGGPDLVAGALRGVRRRRRRVADDRSGRLVGSRQRTDPRRGDSAPARAEGRLVPCVEMEFRRINALPPYAFARSSTR